MAKLSIVEGIGETYEVKLKAVAVNSLEVMLAACATKKGWT